MSNIIKHAVRDLTYRFTGPEFMPADEDEGTVRDAQWGRTHSWRTLKSAEIELLTQQGNTAADWSLIRVTERFNPKLVRACRFGGFVRIGDMENLVLEFEGLRLPVGLYSSNLIACDIGNNAVVNQVGQVANTLVGDETMLHQVGQIVTRRGAKFGSGFLWEGEPDDQRVWIEICNEGGGRRIAAFAGMRPADAWLWAKHRGDKPLLDRLLELTDALGNRAGTQYGMIGNRTAILNARTLLDVRIGPEAVITGANRLENLTVLSDEKEPTRIGEGSDLSHGIVGWGCQVGQGVKASHFVLGSRAKLHQGARLTHTWLGDSSTVACCEVANSLIFPNHEQHHNNSFLIAATLQGQSNVAAGATIGSNHNSRAADGEIVAERGFWPGLCSSFKHPSRFAAYTLVAKGHYAAELNIPYPFSLVSNNEHFNCLQIIPAYWFLYNMYAVMRNAWKFRARDVRKHAGQHIEFSALAPDTVESILAACERLETLTAIAWKAREGNAAETPTLEALRELGRRLLREQPEAVEALELVDEEVENSRRRVRLFKVPAAWAIYREMAHHYAVRTLLEFMAAQGIEDLGALAKDLAGARERRWLNLGGQIVASGDLERLKAGIAQGTLDSWEAIHKEYDRLWAEYPKDRARHALAVLAELADQPDGATPDEAQWAEALARARRTQAAIARQTAQTRAKDFEGVVRQMTFDSAEEMAAVVGTVQEDGFIERVREETERFNDRVDNILERNGLADRIF